jgi:hypothetical protein
MKAVSWFSDSDAGFLPNVQDQRDFDTVVHATDSMGRVSIRVGVLAVRSPAGASGSSVGNFVSSFPGIECNCYSKNETSRRLLLYGVGARVSPVVVRIPIHGSGVKL